MIEFIRGHHLVGRIDVSKHDLLRRFHRVLIVEDKEGVSLHVDALGAIREDLEAVVEVDHAELGNQVVVRLSQLDREARSHYIDLKVLLFEFLRSHFLRVVRQGLLLHLSGLSLLESVQVSLSLERLGGGDSCLSLP